MSVKAIALLSSNTSICLLIHQTNKDFPITLFVAHYF